MSYFKFSEDDVFVNTIESYPQHSFYVYSASVYVDNMPHLSGTRDTVSNTIQGVPNGFISLYEYNIDRPAAQRIYPFLYKDGKKDCFKNISKVDYNTKYYPGDIITSSYAMSASISRDYYAANAVRARIAGLKNTFNHYGFMSQHYEFSSSHLSFDKETQAINLISIPSVFYGSSIKKGTVSLKYYITGTLVGELTDSNKNGELVQRSGTISANDGKIAGVVLYKEGFIALTGSWSLDAATIAYDATGNSKWLFFGYGANDSNTINDTAHSASFLLEYSGTTNTQVMTMFAHADYGELNHSNNPTFITGSDNIKKQFIGKQESAIYQEPPQKIKNIVSSSFTDEDPMFEKVTYINKVGIYDKNKNLIAVANLATPVRKTEDSDFAFKLKLDI